MNWRNDIYFFIINIIAFCLPLDIKLTSPLFIGLGIVWLFDFKEIKGIKNVLKDKYLIGYLVFYILLIISFFISNNRNYASKDLETKLTFFIIPLILGSSDKIKFSILNNFYKILNSFILGLFLSLIINIAISYYKYYVTLDVSYLTYSKFSNLAHPSYYALLLNVGIVVLMGKMINDVGRISVQLFQMLFLAIGVALVGSKAGILSMFILLFLFVLVMFFKLRKIKIGLTFMIMLLSSTLVILNNNALKSRMTEMITTVFVEENEETSSALRLAVWRVAVEKAIEKPIFGYGNGDVIDMLSNEYKIRNLDLALKKHANPHNQFLQTMLNVGLVGLLFFCLILIQSIWLAIKRNDWIWLIFNSLIIFNLFFESMLERQLGIITFVFFNLIFYLYKNGKIIDNQIIN